MYAKPQLQQSKLYYGTLGAEFKLKSNNHNQSFRYRQYANETKCQKTSGS